MNSPLLKYDKERPRHPLPAWISSRKMPIFHAEIDQHDAIPLSTGGA